MKRHGATPYTVTQVNHHSRSIGGNIRLYAEKPPEMEKKTDMKIGNKSAMHRVKITYGAFQIPVDSIVRDTLAQND